MSTAPQTAGARTDDARLVSVYRRVLTLLGIGVLMVASGALRWLDGGRRQVILGVAEQCGLALERAHAENPQNPIVRARLASVLESAGDGLSEQVRARAVSGVVSVSVLVTRTDTDSLATPETTTRSAPASRAPRKMPGNARTLLIWFG